MTPNIPLIAWQPDADPTTPGVLVDVENMVPTVRGYSGSGDLEADTLVTASSTTVPSVPYSAQMVNLGEVYGDTVFVGTDTKIYWIASSTLADISRVAPYTAANAFNAWRFDVYEDTPLAVQYSNVLQRKTGAVMTDVAGAPTADTICKQSEFVMLGNVYDAGWGRFYDGWWCCARTDPTDWTPDVATQCARGRLTQTPGRIVRLVAYQNYILAFKEGSILRGTYVGTPTIWRWDVVSTSVGLVGHDAICEAEGVLYWLGQGGFYRFGGGNVERIVSAPWAWFRQDAGWPVNLRLTLSHFDPGRRVVRWYYNIQSPYIRTSGIAFHIETNRWGRFSSTAYCALNAPIGSGWFDAATAANVYAKPSPLVIDSTRKFMTYAQTTTASSFTTGDIGDDDSVRALNRARVRYSVAPTSVTMTHYHRMNLSDALTTGTTSTRADGKFDVTHSARWHRLKFAQAGKVEVLGYSVDVAQAGKR